MAGSSRASVVANAGPATVLGQRAAEVAAVLGTDHVFFRSGSRWRAATVALRGVAARRPRLVYAVDISVFTVVVALFAAALGARIVFDTGDDIAAIRAKTGRMPSLNRRLGSVLEGLALSCAASVIVRSEGLRDRLAHKTGRTVTVIPDGFDRGAATRADRHSARRRWGVGDGTLTVGVLGSANWHPRLEWCYGCDVIEVVSRVSRSDVVGILLVKGNGLPHLRALAVARGVMDRLIFEEPADGQDVYEQLYGLDVGLSTQTNDRVGQARTTGKLVQYLAADVYVLASRVGDAALLLPAEQCVEYRGAWDPLFFERLACQVDALPERARVKAAAHAVAERVAPRFEYSSLRTKWQQALADSTSA